ncbi:MAG: MFS transporter [Parachlamydiales bacterium]
MGQYRLFRWVVWGLALLFSYYELVLRVSPSVMVPELEGSFQVSAGVVGSVSAFYLYAYAPLQFPIGVMMDRYGARSLLSIASALCGLGALLFSIAPYLALAGGGRFLMGAGSAFAWVGLVYVVTQWFPAGRLALLIGLSNSLGMLGAVTGQGPLSFAITHFGWRPSMLVLGLFGFALATLLYFTARKDPPNVTKASLPPTFGRLWYQAKGVLQNGQSWVIAVGTLFFYIPIVCFAALWGVPFIRAVYGVSQNGAAFTTSLIYIGFIVGGPIIGLLADRFQARKGLLIASTSLALLALMPILYLPQIGIRWASLLLFCLGLFCSAQLLAYSYVTRINVAAAKGTAIAFTNTMVFVGGALVQPLIGILLDLFFPTEGASPSPGAYQAVLALCPATLLIALMVYTLLRPSKAGVTA